MIKYLIFMGLVFLVIYIKKNKIRIKFKSFLKPGVKLPGGQFGVYCYCGKQGSTKTASVVKYLYDHRDQKIYCNMRSIDNSLIPYSYINGLDELLKLRAEHDCIIFFDEIFTEINKHQKISSDVMDFLSQMRKRRIILLTTCQEWRLLPLDFRLYVRYQVNCSCIDSKLFNAISKKKVIDGDNIKWSDEEQDFVGELVETTYWHLEKFICNLYDTYEQIGKYSNYSYSSFSPVAHESKTGEEEEEHESLDLSEIDTDFYDDLCSDDLEEDLTEDEKKRLNHILSFFNKE